MARKRSTLPVHHYRLRPDCLLRLELPDDLNRREAKRLARFIRSLVGEPAWPFRVHGDAPCDDFADVVDDLVDECSDDDEIWVSEDEIRADFEAWESCDAAGAQPGETTAGCGYFPFLSSGSERSRPRLIYSREKGRIDHENASQSPSTE